MGRVKTVTIYEVRTFDGEGNELFGQRAAMKILNINHRKTFNAYVETLNILPKRYKWSDLKEMLELKLFLQDRDGGNTYDIYKNLKARKLIPVYFTQNHIDLDAQLARLKDLYESKNPLSGTTRHTQNGAFTNPPKPQTPVAVMV